MRKFFSISVSEWIEVIVSDLTFNTSSKIWESFVVVFPSDSKTLSLRHKKETLQADEINKKDHREKLSLSISYFFFKKEKKTEAFHFNTLWLYQRLYTKMSSHKSKHLKLCRTEPRYLLK